MARNWLTLKQAAAQFPYSVKELRRKIKAGQLRAGGSIRKLLIDEEHLDQQIGLGFPVLGVRAVPRPKARPEQGGYLTLTNREGKGKK